MEQLQAFVLGIFAVLLILGIVSMFRANKMIAKNNNAIDELKSIEEIHTNDLYRNLQILEEQMSRFFEDERRHTDSRVDKMYNQIHEEISMIHVELRDKKSK